MEDVAKTGIIAFIDLNPQNPSVAGQVKYICTGKKCLGKGLKSHNCIKLSEG